ncbi:hypothetical protein WCX49_01085 [Sulfurimonas sp. HSL-1656]|uniref:hypothetical protein n=1 Tax=Thiomicrolovo subterrani TaxID=3131934 RepID=UPI0031F7F908
MKNMNYRLINGRVYFHHQKDGVDYNDPFIAQWSEWVLLNDGSLGTVKLQAGLIFKFWIWALYFPAGENESLLQYFARYKKVITNRGFEIKKELTLYMGQKSDVMVYKAGKTNSVVNDLSALQSFFRFVYDHKTLHDDLPEMPYSDFYFDRMDREAQNAKDQHSIGHAYGLKPKGMMRESMLARYTALTDMVKAANRKTKKKHFIGLSSSLAMPLDFFDHLLVVAPPAAKLLYLLCATSARIGQALHLTWFDVDVDRERVYLVNPRSPSKQLPVDANGFLFLQQPPRKELLKLHGINLDLGHHQLVRWKTGEIPSIDDDEGHLFFIHPVWKEMFFHTYLKVFNNTPAKHRKNNPFVFQTSTGKRLLPSEAKGWLDRDINAVRKQFPAFEGVQLEGGFHLFRHMFASLMASLAYLELSNDERMQHIDTGGGKTENIIEITKAITRRKMGHAAASDSIEVYFKADHYITAYHMNILRKRVEEYRELRGRIGEAIDVKIVGN